MVRSTLLCLGLLTVLAACSSGGGGGTSTGAGHPEKVAAAEPAGSYTSEKDGVVDQYGSYPPEFSLGDISNCSEKDQFDPTLRVGDTFVSQSQSARASQSSSSTSTSVVDTLTDTYLKVKLTFTDLKTSDGSFPISKVEAQTVCDLTKTGSDQCSFDITTPLPQTSTPSSSSSCSSDYKAGHGKITGTVSIGRYVLSNGTSFRAQVVKMETPDVTIKCGDQVMGKGIEVSERVTTLDLPTTFPARCYRITNVFDKTVLKLNDGTVIHADSQEVISAPASRR